MATSKIIFGAGCFWGVEVAFRRIRGVTNVTCGYSGGHSEHPTYEAVCSNTTGHIEVVLVEYDSAAVSLETWHAIPFGDLLFHTRTGGYRSSFYASTAAKWTLAGCSGDKNLTRRSILRC